MSIDKSTLEELKIDRSRAAKKSPLGKIIFAAAVVILLAVGFAAWKRHTAIAVVRTVVAQESAPNGVQTVLNASGYVTARREATVSSKVTGQIIEVDFEEGQKVEAGQVLARVDPSNINTSLHLAESQLDSARIALQETKVMLEQAQRDLKRTQTLATNQIATQAELDKATSDADMLSARLQRLQAEIVVAEKQVAYWKQQFDDTIIRAPFSGIVVSKAAQAGEMISPMSAGGAFTRTGVCTIVDMTSLEIEVDVNENYINRVQPSQPVEAILDAYADWRIPAKVIAIIPTADRQKSTVKVRIGFEKLDPRILPDMGVKVSFLSTGENKAMVGVTIPKSALRNDGDQIIVLAMKDGHAVRHQVKAAVTNEEEVVISSGLANGEKVIVDGPAELKGGEPVQEKQQQ